MPPNILGLPEASSGRERKSPKRSRGVVRTRRRVRSREPRSEKLVKIVTTTKRFHEPVGEDSSEGFVKEKRKEEVHGSRGKLPAARKKTLIKAMRAAIKSPNTPPHLKKGLRKKLAQWRA